MNFRTQRHLMIKLRNRELGTNGIDSWGCWGNNMDNNTMEGGDNGRRTTNENNAEYLNSVEEENLGEFETE